MRNSVFKRNGMPKRHLRTTGYDLSFQNNGTYQLGKLYPVFLDELQPGEKVKIDPTALMRMEPMCFPVQSNMRCNINFFVVKHRNIWKDWQDFITNVTGDTYVRPYIWQPKNSSFFKTGSLADYLGVATETYSETNKETFHAFPRIDWANTKEAALAGFNTTSEAISQDWKGSTINNVNCIGKYTGVVSGQQVNLFNCGNLTDCDKIRVYGTRLAKGLTNVSFWLGNISNGGNTAIGSFTCLGTTHCNNGITTGTGYLDISKDANPRVWDLYNEIYSGLQLAFTGNLGADGMPSIFISICQGVSPESAIAFYKTVVNESVDDSPFYSEHAESNGKKLNALPFRAYEAVYNAYYRNQLIEPLIVNGKKKYNQWNTTLEGGRDTTPYTFFNQNWETDVFTSCLPNTQLGKAPLVGVTEVSKNGEFKFINEDGNTTIATTTLDGEKIIGVSMVSGDNAQEVLHNMVQLIKSGISINSLRNCSALQRLLENKIRAGLQYREQIRGIYGVDTGRDVLQMPLYIGGVTGNIEVKQVLNNSASEGATLGDRAGLGDLHISNQHGVTYKADDFCYVIGIMNISLDPTYSQSMNKLWYKDNYLDWYAPEFQGIGMQPVSNAEVAPLQFFNKKPETLNAVFGYQRAWYDSIYKLDEVHGQMRTTYKDYVIMRKFTDTPALNAAFIHVDPATMNNPFVDVNIDDDIVRGAIWFKYYKEALPPRFSSPTLV